MIYISKNYYRLLYVFMALMILVPGVKAIAAPVAPIISNPDFESGMNGWNFIHKCYRIEPRGGRNGSSGMLYERKNAKEYLLSPRKIKLKPGMLYRYGAWVRCENVKGGGAQIAIEFNKNHSFIGGNYSKALKGTTDWTLIEGEVLIPKDADACQIVLYLSRKTTGKAWFDDVFVEPAQAKLEMHIVSPSCQTISTRGGILRVNFFRKGDNTLIKFLNGLKLKIQIGTDKNIKTFYAKIENHSAEIKLPNLSAGELPLKLTLFNPSKKTVVMKKTSYLRILPEAEKIPDQACMIDSHGRAIVNGKPYLPIGLYLHNIPKEVDMKLIINSPFNCIMPYCSPSLRMPGEKKSVEELHKTMDYLHQNNIKVIFSLKDIYDGQRWQKNSYLWRWWGKPQDKSNTIVSKIVKTIRNHPALLAWYINDECSTSMMDVLVNRRKLVNRLDPYHPTWAVLYQFEDLPLFASSCDVIGADPYPINVKRIHDNMIKNKVSMNGVDASGLPAWVVPQIFNQGVYFARGNTKKFHEYADPTEKQMRGMTLYMALRGAKGFVYYSFFDLKRPLSAFKPPVQTQADFDRRWTEVCRVGAMLKELEPFLLSNKPAQKVEIKVEKGMVEAKAFFDDQGNVRIIIAGVGPGKASAVITSTVPMQLKSIYGNCVSLGNNRYRFTGNDICSDILSGKK